MKGTHVDKRFPLFELTGLLGKRMRPVCVESAFNLRALRERVKGRPHIQIGVGGVQGPALGNPDLAQRPRRKTDERVVLVLDELQNLLGFGSPLFVPRIH